MRNSFADKLVELAQVDGDIYWLMGDLGFGVVDDFQEKFPDRLVNAGVAEQNMTGVAAGLALSGKVVFTYSIANFPTIRCLEQIRNDVCYHDLNVNIVSVGAGFSYGSLGSTHHGTEDIAILRSLPNMKVVVPADPIESEQATKALYEDDGPSYLRLGRSGEPDIHPQSFQFELGKAAVVKNGTDLTFIGSGGVTYNAIQAARKLEEVGHSIQVISAHTLKPFDRKAIIQAAKQTKKIITVEEHSNIGGLGSLVKEIIAEEKLSEVDLTALDLDDKFTHEVGDQEYLREKNSLDPESLFNEAQNMLERR